MVIVCILGGIASGKSLVAQQLVAHGAELIDADRLGHAVLQEPDVREAVRARWGPAVLDAQGQVVRQALARIVFAAPPDGPVELARLEQLTHPRITRRVAEELERLRRRGVAVAVLDAPVLLKAGWHTFCNRTLFVDAPRHLRLQRARQRGWSDEEFAAREAAQESFEEKRARADQIIDNSDTPAGTCAQVRRFWDSLETTSRSA